jgi:hypothetical protein
MFRDAGFEGVKVLRERDYFALSRSEETRDVARRFGAYAIELATRRGAAAPSTAVRYARRADPRRALRALVRRGLAGTVALVLSVLACYGTLAATALLPLAGVTLAIDPALWAGTVVALGLLAAGAVAASARRHGGYAALALAVAGAATLAYVQFANYRLDLELLAFGLLAAGVALDFRRRRDGGTEPA